ncbi:hypothetical protein PIROE2DRAFT_8775 [Piromyces sp. E2]|nr:hypothetical protein PIROE2DRAFT_8775 [Piromyces sp. E2]|eukprot:OUM64464.1 hypothetical protein PIROE2DRAFT_8775 [Piromyces sp. E2]
MCVESYLKRVYPERNWKLLAEAMWKATNNNWGDWTDMYSGFLPEVLLQYDNYDQDDFASSLSEQKYIELKALYSGITEGKEDDPSDELNYVLNKPFEMAMVYEGTGIGDGSESIDIINRIETVLNDKQIPLPDYQKVLFSKFEELNGWGNDFDVYSVISVSSFFNKGERAELFELLDEEVPIVKIFIPDEEFIELQDRAIFPNKLNFEKVLVIMPNVIKNYLLEFQKINFNNVFPGYNFGEILPELIIDENGNSNIDTDQIVSGFNYNPKHYDEGNPEKFINHLLATNENFKLLDIINILKGMKMANTGNEIEIEFRYIIENVNEYFISQIEQSDDLFDLDSSLKNIKTDIIRTLKYFKILNFTSIYPGYDFVEILPDLQIAEDGYAKFDIKEVYRGFNFDPEYYKENYPDIKTDEQLLLNVFSSNDNFDILKISEYLGNLKMSEDKDKFYLVEKMKNISNTLNITTESHRENINQNKKNQAFYDGTLTKFKTKNATMTFNLNGNEKKFKKVTFSLSGQYSRHFSKPNYNLKIRGGKDLYGRSHFKLRSDCIEPTFLRTKLVSDIHNRLGLKSGSANYIQLYINDKYMGLYIITDLFKSSWIERVYGEKDTTTLYKCKNIHDFSPAYSEGCVNENEDVTDKTEWINFLTAVKNAKSASDLEDIFEIDHILYEMAIEYLTSGWDHIQNTHNFYLYKQPNGKWIYLSYDFDLDIGQNNENSFDLKFNEFTRDIHIIDLLILKDPSRFDKILKDVVNKVFNPSILYPHIDELKQFIKPYVELDKIPNSQGQYLGRFDNKFDLFSLEQWDAYSEFNTGESDRLAYELKYWILMEYRTVCRNYNMECDPIYMDENYEYPIVEIDDDYFMKHESGQHSTEIYSDFEISTEIPNNHITEILFENPTKILNESTTEISTEIPTEIPNDNTTKILNEIPSDTTTKILFEKLTEIPSNNVIDISTENSTIIQTEITTTTIKNPSEHSTSSVLIEEETVYVVDVPTVVNDDESYSEEEEEEDITESIESSSSSISKSTITKTIKKTITETITETFPYKTILN